MKHVGFLRWKSAWASEVAESVWGALKGSLFPQAVRTACCYLPIIAHHILFSSSSSSASICRPRTCCNELIDIFSLLISKMSLDQSPRSNHPGLWHLWNPDPVCLDCNFGYNLFSYGIKWNWWKWLQRNKKDHGVPFDINNCSSIASARQARFIMYTGTMGIMLKKIRQ